MNERVKRVPPQFETTQPTYSFLRRAFTHPKFVKSVVAVANHTARYGAEAGFIVQQNKDEVIISKVLKSPRMGSYEDRKVSESIEIEKLCATIGLQQDDQTVFRYKPGIILTLHSHPSDHFRDSLSYLRPSLGDLDIWMEDRSLFRSPHLLEVILVAYEKNPRLFLYQADPELELTNEYQGWDTGRESLEELYLLMSQSGMRFGFMNFDLRSKAFSEADLEQLKIFTTE